MKRTLKTTIGGVFLCLSIASASAVTFVNGDFEGYLGNTNSFNSDVPPGWTITGGTPDVWNASTNFQNMKLTASNSGGDFLHSIGDQPSYEESAVQDGVAGLIIGNVYELSFEQSIVHNRFWTETGGFWRIKFGTEVQDSALMALPAEDMTGPWKWHTMYFTATATVQTLEVLAVTDTNGFRTDVLIDGFYLGAPRDNPPGDNLRVPDAASSLLLLGASLAGLAAFKRRR